MRNAIAEKQATSRLFLLVDQLVLSSQPSIERSQSCIVNDIPEDLLTETDPDLLSKIISGMLHIAIVHAKDSCIRISATLHRNMVMLNLRDYNRFNSYSNPSGLQQIQAIASRIGGTLAVAAMRQGEKTIAFSFPQRQEVA